jgi:hypothetical protein
MSLESLLRSLRAEDTRLLHRGVRLPGVRFLGRRSSRRSRAELYEEARRLGIKGRSTMTVAELEAAVRGRGGARRKPAFAWALLAGFGPVRRRVTAFLGAVLAFAFLRRAKPVRVLILTVSALAAATLGLMTAYAISPEQESAAQVLVTNGTTYRIATVTGPGGTTTVAVTKTKEGKTRIVPVRILDTVTGPGGTETVSVQVLGPARTVTDRQLLTQIETQSVTRTETQIINQTQTDVVTQIKPTTVVVTDVLTQTVREVETQQVTVVDTVVVTQTETVVVTETVTVTVPPPP